MGTHSHARLAVGIPAISQALLDEYLASKNFEETVGCLRTLDAPHYYHELTKRALLAAFEAPGQAPALLALLRRLSDTGAVSQVENCLRGTCNIHFA